MTEEEKRLGFLSKTIMQKVNVVELDQGTEAAIKREVRTLVVREVQFFIGILACLLISVLAAVEGISFYYSNNLEASLALAFPFW